MTGKRFKEIISTQKVIDTQTGKEYDCLLDNDFYDLVNKIAEENIQLKQKKKSKRKTRLVHQHIIRITYPYGTDVEDTKYMIKHIKSVITRETGVEPTIEEYLL